MDLLINKNWRFTANGIWPDKERAYFVLDKFGNQGMALWGNSDAPNESASFFDNDVIKANNIICWIPVEDMTSGLSPINKEFETLRELITLRFTPKESYGSAQIDKMIDERIKNIVIALAEQT